MKGYESTLFSRLNGNELTFKILSSLGVGSSTEVDPWNPQANIRSVETSRLCSVISAYRLLDVVAMLSGGDPAGRVERTSIQGSIGNFRVSNTILT